MDKVIERIDSLVANEFACRDYPHALDHADRLGSMLITYPVEFSVSFFTTKPFHSAPVPREALLLYIHLARSSFFSNLLPGKCYADIGLKPAEVELMLARDKMLIKVFI